MNLASPVYINEIIESVLFVFNEEGVNWMGGVSGDQSTNAATHGHDNQSASAEWAQMLEAATQRRTEVLMPENLENLWTKGRDYKRRENRSTKVGFHDHSLKNPATDSSMADRNFVQEISRSKPSTYAVLEGKPSLHTIHTVVSDPQLIVGSTNRSESSANHHKELSLEAIHHIDEAKDLTSNESKAKLKRSNSASAIGMQPENNKHGEGFRGKSVPDMVVKREGQSAPKLRCRVIGAYFEKLGSTSFAVYSIAVTDGKEKTWFVRRRYRNFERLHRHLKEIPNYALHLPPKRIFSSSTEDAFVHQRCIRLDKYLQDLLSIPNVAEQHEVWDFLSASSKNYSFGKSSSMMRTLAVNVDDAVDDIMHQFKGVSGGFMQKAIGLSPSTTIGPTSSTWNSSWNAVETDENNRRLIAAESALNSNNEEGEKEANCGHLNIDSEIVEDNGWHSDNELRLKDCSQQAINHSKESSNLDLDSKNSTLMEGRVGKDAPATNCTQTADNLEDPPEILWPGGTFFLRVQTAQILVGGSGIDRKTLQEINNESIGSMIPKTESGSFKQQLEAARRASDLKKLLFDGAPAALVSLIGQKQYRRCASDIYFFSQSSICVKQLAYAILELLLISLFPELRNVVMSVHENMHVHQPV